jgi:integrase
MPITRHHTGRWYFQFDKIIEGQRQRANKLLPKGTTRAQADAYDQREVTRLWEVATGGKRDEPLIDDAVLTYLEDHGPDGKHPLKNHADIEAALFLLHPFYCGKTVGELRSVVDDYFKNAKPTEASIAKGIKKLSRATIKNRLSYLRSACRYHWKVNGKKGPNPADAMDLPTVNNARHVYLTRTEANRVFRAMGYGYARDAARMAYYTGWRISEVLGAVAEKSPDGWSLSIPDSKNGLPRKVPVHPTVAYLAERHWPPKITKWTASKATKAALRRVGLGHARLHDLRHSAASAMVNAGVDLYTVGGVLGHKSQVSTARYAHLAQERLRSAVGAIGRKSHPAPEAKAA